MNVTLGLWESYLCALIFIAEYLCGWVFIEILLRASLKVSRATIERWHTSFTVTVQVVQFWAMSGNQSVHSSTALLGIGWSFTVSLGSASCLWRQQILPYLSCGLRRAGFKASIKAGAGFSLFCLFVSPRHWDIRPSSSDSGQKIASTWILQIECALEWATTCHCNLEIKLQCPHEFGALNKSFSFLGGNVWTLLLK